jgi:chromosome segregation ATPase
LVPKFEKDKYSEEKYSHYIVRTEAWRKSGLLQTTPVTFVDSWYDRTNDEEKIAFERNKDKFIERMHQMKPFLVETVTQVAGRLEKCQMQQVRLDTALEKCENLTQTLTQRNDAQLEKYENMTQTLTQRNAAQLEKYENMTKTLTQRNDAQTQRNDAQLEKCENLTRTLTQREDTTADNTRKVCTTLNGFLGLVEEVASTFTDDKDKQKKIDKGFGLAKAGLGACGTIAGIADSIGG